ncbi:MAG: hypothetical protein R2873_04515 [Caldilineaceae bacterium]
MNRSHITTITDSEWREFQQHLADYVRMELDGGPADTTYPDIAFWIESSAACEEAYSLEFHRQGMAQSASDLQHLGQRSLAAGALRSDHGQAGARCRKLVRVDAGKRPRWLERGRICGDKWRFGCRFSASTPARRLRWPVCSAQDHPRTGPTQCS